MDISKLWKVGRTMKQKDKRNQILISNRIIIAVLLIVSLLMTSGTLAYWSEYVEGTETDITTSFDVGKFPFHSYQFVLDSDVNSYRYKVDVDYLLENRDQNFDELIFAVVLTDERYKDLIEVFDIEIELELIIQRNGKDVKSNTYKRYSKLFDITLHEDNQDEIMFGESPVEQTIEISLHDGYKDNLYKKLERYEVYIQITFTID